MHSQLLNVFLQQNSSALPVKDFLQQVADEHPYFTPAQFFLLQQLHETGDAYAAQAAKTSLLFNNPHWLQFKLQQAATVKQAPVVPMYAANSDNDDGNAVMLASDAEPTAAFETTTPPDNHYAYATADYAANSDNDDDNAELVADGSNMVTTAATASPGIIPHAENVQDIPAAQQYAENSDNDDDSAVLENSGESDSAGMSVAAAATDITTDEKNDINDTDEPLPAEDENNTNPMPELKIDLAASVKAAEDENAPAFEPMHLVDYFASQGIKLSEELQTGDKLGKQLKSFTEWLKTMKKVHAAEAAAGNGNAEVAVQALAEKSNAENEVLTEAMAQVFTQQGKRGKAIELYQKLSLLNPAKSAYFAAQIEKLKG